MWLVIVVAVGLAAILYEFRLRRPDQLILYESKGTIGFRKARWYPRHFSLAVPGTTHLMEPKIEATAKGSIAITARLSVAVAASRDSVPALVRAGGWNSGAVARAAKELDALLQGHTREFTEKFAIEELSSENIHAYLLQKVPPAAQKLGLEVVGLTVQSIDPVDATIAEAMRQRESARILEQTEILNQKARVAAAQAKIRADEQISYFEHELELKRYDLKRAELEKESSLAQRRVEDEVHRSKLKLEFDREEMELLKENPQLLLLTPQVARLAEASQSLRNARTVVSLSPNEVEQGSKLLNMFQLFLQNMFQGSTRSAEKKPKSS
jgi:SPFH domain / Band 7 family